MPERRTQESRGTKAFRVLAVGGELKSTVCLLQGDRAIISEHLGDLTRPEAYRNFSQAIGRLKTVYQFEPEMVAHDLHPQYLSTRYAMELGVESHAVQHHHAHVVSVMAEHGITGPVIGLACDGTGYGTDGAVWGCEVLRCELHRFKRMGQLAYFPLVGGDVATVETWRPAAALVGMTNAEAACSIPVDSGVRISHPAFAAVDERRLGAFVQQAAAGINCPPSSSLGRLFDAVSFLLGLCSFNRHEAEAAMALEAAAGTRPAEPLPYEIQAHDGYQTIQTAPTVRAVLELRAQGADVGTLAARFHETVARMLVDAAKRACDQTGLRTLALSGGCFANRRLLSRVVELLECAGLAVLYHQRVPCGDGGLSLGQAVAARQMARRAPA